jgi:hypothetical protein
VTVIVVSLFESVFADHSKDHAVAVAYVGDTLTASRTPLCWTQLTAMGVSDEICTEAGLRRGTGTATAHELGR